jgi:hypothetical protein
VEVGVVGDGEGVFELSYPLAHLCDLAVQLLCVGKDESEAIQSNRGVPFQLISPLTENHGRHAMSLNSDRQINYRSSSTSHFHHELTVWTCGNRQSAISIWWRFKTEALTEWNTASPNT